MESADQQPRPEETSTGASSEGTGQEEVQPLYEFPPALDTPQESPSPDASTQPDAAQGQTPEAAPLDPRALEQAVRQGLIYPPPPSYYQNMSPPSEQPAFAPPVPRPSVVGQARPFVAPPARPPYPPPIPPAAARPAKRSRKWIWIIVSVLAVALLASCGLCGWGFYTILNPAIQNASASLQTVNDFYANLQSQNYAGAYDDLDMPQLTEAQFTQQAQQADQQRGTIQSYTPQQTSVGLGSNNGPDLSHFSYIVQVTRAHSSYSALITVTQEGKSWKITDFDRL